MVLLYLTPIALSVAGICLYDIKGYSRGRLWLFRILVAYIILFFGLRHNIGEDTVNLYIPYYEAFPTFSDYSLETFHRFAEFSPGFQMFFLLFKSMGAPFWVVQMVQALFVNLVLFAFLKKHTRWIFTGVLFFISFAHYYSAEIMRESIAVCIFVLAYPWLLRHKWIKYYCAVVLAMMFHMSAIILLAFPLAYHFRLRFDRSFLWVVLGVAVFYALVRMCISYTPYVIGDVYGEKAIYYSHMYDAGLRNINYLVTYSIKFLVTPLIFIYTMRDIVKMPVKFETMVCLSVLVGLGFPFLLESSARFFNYVMPFFLLSAADAVGDAYHRRESRSRMLTFAVGAFVLCMFYYHTVKHTIVRPHLYPYECVLTQ